MNYVVLKRLHKSKYVGHARGVAGTLGRHSPFLSPSPSARPVALANAFMNELCSFAGIVLLPAPGPLAMLSRLPLAFPLPLIPLPLGPATG
ncbi:hypothetical protein A0H81_07351 [Grifola frondosa]|uniref:Uncharacterized protein n=1 Tax=Grifola frondosa TaxID=5627 RepID=A0A1C7M7B8_GRIFR|nr:hypothetical protein A0H81_07351 [Grifola frondosa]